MPSGTVCDRAMQLGCDARTVRMLSSAVCASVMQTGMLGSNQRQILRETFRGKDRRLHFEKCTKKFAKIHVIFFTFQIVNIRKDCLVRL